MEFEENVALVTPGRCRNEAQKPQIKQDDVIGNAVFLKPLRTFTHIAVDDLTPVLPKAEVTEALS